jgi:DNA invertase Pin-like site-specific DNA recombinase
MCGREFAKQDDAVDVTKSSIPHKIGRGLDRMIEQLREAAVVVITTYDRLSRSLQNLLNIVEAIRAKVVGFRTMAKDTNFNAGRLVFASIAQFERERISEQTKEGLCLSTSEGGLAVSPHALSPERRAEAARMHNRERHGIAELGWLFQVSANTIQRA